MKSKCLVIFIILSFVLSACRTDDYGNGILLEEEGLKDTLTIELVGHDSNSLLYQKMMSFAENQPNLEVRVRRYSYGYNTSSAWIMGGGGPDDPPDLLEITPNQMKLWFHHDKIEALSIREPEHQDFMIHSPDGYVLGVVTKINPLVVFYNREVLRRYGLESPINEWDWVQFEQVIKVLKENGENVYILADPYLLEWVTINRFGGRIVDSSGTVFKGYLDSEEGVQAAEWLFSINTRLEDYKHRLIGSNYTYVPMPYDLIENNIALAVYHPLYRKQGHDEIIELNDRIGIAPLPGGDEVINPAMMSGLVIHKDSRNKEAAMALLRYLLEESNDFHRDTLVQTYQAISGKAPNEGSDEWSIILQEAKRSVPVTLMMNEGGIQWSITSYRSLYHAMKNGQSAKELLQRDAEKIDAQFEELKKDFNPKFRKPIMTAII